LLMLSLATILFSSQIVQASGVDQVKSGLEISAGPDGAGLPTDEISRDLPTRLGKTINYSFSLLGTIVLGVTLMGGLRWMTAGGNEEKVGKAKHFIIGGINGLIVIFLAYALVYVFLAALTAATG